MHLFILQQLMVILDMQWLLKGMHYIKVMIQVLTYIYCSVADGWHSYARNLNNVLENIIHMKGMLFSKGNQVMKKWLFVILSVVVIWGIYRYCNDKLEENAGVSNHGGIHQYEEEAIVEDINLDNREIVVRIKESDTYLESKKNPYKDKKISLDCSKSKKRGVR